MISKAWAVANSRENKVYAKYVEEKKAELEETIDKAIRKECELGNKHVSLWISIDHCEDIVIPVLSKYVNDGYRIPRFADLESKSGTTTLVSFYWD